MSKTHILAAFAACSVFALSTQAYDKNSHEQQREYIKSLQVKLQQNEVEVVRHQRELRRAIKAASRDF